MGEDVLGPNVQVAALSACVKPLTGRELERASQQWAEARYEIRIGWQPTEIKCEYWIDWRGKTLDILDVQGAGTRELEWTIIAKDHVE